MPLDEDPMDLSVLEGKIGELAVSLQNLLNEHAESKKRVMHLDTGLRLVVAKLEEELGGKHDIVVLGRLILEGPTPHLTKGD